MLTITIFRTSVLVGGGSATRGVVGVQWGQPRPTRHNKGQIFWRVGGYLKIWKDKSANRNYIPCLATKQRTYEMISARHRSATLPAHSMGYRNYPSSKSQIPPPMGRTHFPILSEWKAESAWPRPRWDPTNQIILTRPATAGGRGKYRKLLPNSLKMPDNCRVKSVNCLTMTENYKNAKMLQLLENSALIYFFPLSYNRLNLIYLHGKSVVIGFQAWGIQIWYYCKTKLYGWNLILKRIQNSEKWVSRLGYKGSRLDKRRIHLTGMFLLIVTRQKLGRPFQDYQKFIPIKCAPRLSSLIR